MKEREIVASDPSEAAECNGMTGCLKGDHQYVALRRQGVIQWDNAPSTEKTLITEEKEKKWDRSTRLRPTANGERLKRTYDCPLGM
jgi:hypothetical protein